MAFEPTLEVSQSNKEITINEAFQTLALLSPNITFGKRGAGVIGATVDDTRTLVFGVEVEILGVYLYADQSGDIELDLWVSDHAGYPPVVGGSIVAAAPPAISGADKSFDVTLTAWTKIIPAGSILFATVTSCVDINECTMFLPIRKTGN